MTIQRTYSNAPREEQVGYCRALRSGDQIYVTGSAPVGERGETVGVGDGYAPRPPWSRCGG